MAVNKLTLYSFLNNTSCGITIYKLAIIAVLIFIGCIYNPFMFLAFLVALVFISFENSVKSIGFVLGLYPYYYIFYINVISLSL